LSNEEKTNDYENFEKGMIYMKILKKGGGGNEIHAPCACAWVANVFLKYGFGIVTNITKIKLEKYKYNIKNSINHSLSDLLYILILFSSSTNKKKYNRTEIKNFKNIFDVFE
jgi:hypothetical protein